MDRMDVQIWMSPPKKLVPDNLDTKFMREKVKIARQRQQARYGDSGMFNGTVSDACFRKKANVKPQAYMALKELTDEGIDLGRASERLLRIARTLADLDGAAHVTDEHVFQAAQFRKLMSKMVMLW
jgi:magnesium chelatase family protein